MKRYKVTLSEWICNVSSYEVEAKNKSEAIKKCKNGEGEHICSDTSMHSRPGASEARELKDEKG